MTTENKCELCGESMPKSEESFRYHGHSGPCPKPPLKTTHPTDLDAYVKEREESAFADFKAWIKYQEKTEKRFARGEEIVRWWTARNAETIAGVLERVREYVATYTVDMCENSEEFKRDILSFLSNPAQS